METGYLAPSGKYLDVSFLAVCLLILFFFAVAPVLLLVFPVPFPVTIFVPQTAALILLFLAVRPALV